MSSTITEMERRIAADIPSTKLLSSESSETLSRRRARLIRTTSIDKLKKFNTFICSQHYCIIPSLILWLKTSQTVFTSHMDKLMVYVKSMFLICVIREFIQKKVRTLGSERSKVNLTIFLKNNTKDLLVVLNLFVICLNNILSFMYAEVKRAMLVSAVYLGVVLIFLQMICCTMFIFSTIPRWGFLFLVGCVLIMSKIAVKVMFQNVCLQENKITNLNSKPVEERKRIRKQLNMIGKTISNVKLF